MAAARVWRILYYPAGDTPSRECKARAPDLDAAKRRLAHILRVPAWTLR